MRPVVLSLWVCAVGLTGCEVDPDEATPVGDAAVLDADADLDARPDAAPTPDAAPEPDAALEPDATIDAGPDAAIDAEPDAAPDADPGPDCPLPPPADAESITFYAMGDPQYGGGADDKNTFQINALEAFSGVWPDGLPSAGEPVEPPLGLLIAGDLTQSGHDDRLELIGQTDQIGAFVAEYGLRGGDGDLSMPIYEGYGNHEYDPDEPGEDDNLLQWRYHYTDDPTPAVDAVAIRNARRCNLTRIAPGLDGHYSWDWGRVHFVNADLFPGDAASDADENAMIRDPRRALTFLRADLAAEVGDSGRPVVIMAHYGFDNFGQEPRWWTAEQKVEFYEAVEGYNVVAYIHGHTHATDIYTWRGIDIFNVGSPYYTNYNRDGRGHFTVFRISGTHLEAADVSWSPELEGGDPTFRGWTFSKPL